MGRKAQEDVHGGIGDAEVLQVLVFLHLDGLQSFAAPNFVDSATDSTTRRTWKSRKTDPSPGVSTSLHITTATQIQACVTDPKTPHNLATVAHTTCQWKAALYPSIIELPKSYEKLHITTSFLQLHNWDQTNSLGSPGFSPIVITSDPLPTTNATASDLIACHSHGKLFHSVIAHNP